MIENCILELTKRMSVKHLMTVQMTVKFLTKKAHFWRFMAVF
jgi:hypothetical protein